MLAALLLATLLLGSCTTPGDSLPFEERGRDWLVRANCAEDADTVAELVVRLAPAVRMILDAGACSVTVLISRDSTPTGTCGQVLPNGVILLDGVPGPQLETILAHELAHRFLMTDDVWDQLPGNVEEGLADLVAGTVVRRSALALEFSHHSALPEDGSLEFARSAIRALLTEDLYEEDNTNARRMRAIGFVIARRLGVDGLRSLCERSQHRENDKIPADWLLDACGFGETDEPGVWGRLLDGAERDGWRSFPISVLEEGTDAPTAESPAPVPRSK